MQFKRLLISYAAVGAGVLFGQVNPGLVIPPANQANDQKDGSVLIYNLFTSGANQDTKISLTNQSTTSAAFVRLFFVDGGTGQSSNKTVCLTSNQTLSFKASQVVPGRTGFVIAVPIDGVVGCPFNHNFLSGLSEVRLASGEVGTLPAVGYSALFAGVIPGCDANSVTSVLNLNGVDYNRAPRAVQIPSIASSTEGSSLLVLNRIGGNLLTSYPPIGPLDGYLFNDFEQASFFQANIASPQARLPISNSFPLTAPPFSSLITAGHTGWMKLWEFNDIGLSGSVLTLSKVTTESSKGNSGKTTTSVSTSPTGGYNLRTLSESAASNLTVNVAVPTCN